MDLVDSSICPKIVYLTENIIVKPHAKSCFYAVIEETYANDIDNRRRQYIDLHQCVPLRIDFAVSHGIGRSCPAATRASVLASSC